MDLVKAKRFNERMGKRPGFAKGGHVKRVNFDIGGAVGAAGGGAAAGAAIGSVIPGIGTAIGGAVGAIGGFLSSLFGGGGPQMPNITDPVTGAQITDAAGRVIASQDQLASFANNLQGADGVKNQTAVFNQLQGVANGTGPNPAAAMLAESTGQNVANQGALMAGQRGASSNVGLIARESAQQGAATQQQAVGQAATLESNQQLNALNSEGAIAGQQVGETQNALSASNTAATNNQGQLLNAEGQYNTNITGGQGNVNTNNTSTTNTLIPQVASVVKGVAAGVGDSATKTGTTGTAPPAATTAPKLAQGGEVMDGPHQSHVANFLALAKGGKVPAMVSPNEVYLSPEKVRQVIHEGANPLKIGEKIGGKAKVKGDSRKNDTVPKTLEEGGVVIPRSHVKNPEKAELFVHKAVLKHMKRPGAKS